MILSTLTRWVNQEPAAALWLAVAACLLFGAAFTRSRTADDRAWTWLRRLIEALAQALAFAALALIFQFILTSSFSAFNRIYASFTTGGSISNTAWAQWRELYGEALVQQDLTVTQTFPTDLGPQPLPTREPSGPVYYQNATGVETVQQNSITGFEGLVTVELHKSWRQKDNFNGFIATARYAYQITNPTEQTTQASFRFPLRGENKLYEKLRVTRGGSEVTGWQMIDNAIVWTEKMNPRQVDEVVISYVTYGMNGFLFEVPEAREMAHFKLTVTSDVDNC